MKRWKVDFEFGHAIFADEKTAREMYENPEYDCIRLLELEDIYDEGTLIAGRPIIRDLAMETAPTYEELVGKFISEDYQKLDAWWQARKRPNPYKS